MTDRPLSERVHAAAVAMWRADNRVPRPNLEDFAHLDVVPAARPEPSTPLPTPIADPAAVAAVLSRMQSQAKVRFAEPVVQQPQTQTNGRDARDA